MRIAAKMLLFAAAPLLVTGCKSATKVENVTITNDIAVNAAAPADDGMINYADPAEAGNAAGAP